MSTSPINPEQLLPTALIGVKFPQKTHVLVVDDEKTNVELLCRFLAKQGYEAEGVFNGQQALDAIKQRRPDVVLLDVSMPVMSGLELTRILREDFATRSLPVIFITARNTLEDRLQGLRAGVDDYIGKPFDLEEVKARLEGTLQRRRWDMALHPLTRLPGSPAIEDEVWKRLRVGSLFTFAYIDIDNFKSYNDTYGYDAGDRMIKRLAGFMMTAVEDAPRGCRFAGHIGGDDFVFISTPDGMQQALLAITQAFDAQRTSLYKPEDIERGFIRTTNRQGKAQDFPLATLSVAVVNTETHRVLHYARLAEIASELKHHVKTKPHKGHSLILWDRRGDTIAKREAA